MIMTISIRLLAVLLMTCVAGCDFLLGDDELPVLARQRGVVEYYGDSVAVETPASVIRDQPFEVSLRTYGGGCIRQGDTEVRLQGLVATLEPYDSFLVKAPARYACTSDLRLFSHKVLLTFEQSGNATVQVLGRREPGGAVITVTRTVTVQ
jgi:hypothetical protein